MKNPKVTVLMSVYNGEKYLQEAIDSILGQTFKDFEFLIVNDGSTDKTEEILKSYNDPRIKIIDNEKNIGLTKSLNKGLKLTRGEYIARMDADDVSMPERLEKEVVFLDNNKNMGLVGTYYFETNENGKVLYITRPLNDSKALKEKLLMINQFGHGSVMFKKECIEKVGLYRREFKSAQDYDLWLRISEKYNIANLPEPLYKRRLNIDSISVNKKKQQDKYAKLAIEFSKERKLFGKDKLQLFTKQEIESYLYDLMSESLSLSRKDISQKYFFFSRTLFNGKDYRGALKLLLKAIITYPFYKSEWMLLFKVLICLLLPERIIEMLRFLKKFIST